MKKLIAFLAPLMLLLLTAQSYYPGFVPRIDNPVSGATSAPAPIFVAAASAAATASVSKPSGTADGDYVVAIVNHGSTEAIAVPNTWTHLAAQVSQTGGGASDIFGHCANGDGATYSFTGGTTESICVASYRNTHCNIDGAPVSTTADSTTPQVPAIVTTATNDMVVGLMDVGGTGFTAPATSTARCSVAFAGGSNYGSWIGDVPQATATTVAADIGTFSPGSSYVGWRIGVRQ